MTAQIRPNRMEVSDRFPMLGFAVRVDEPNVEAEVVLANDIALFGPQGKARRTAANFYSSQEHGTLNVPRGDGVFVVAPEVLARFIGSEKLYFGLATGHAGNGGLQVDALPREGSPYVSLRGFTGRTLRRSFGSSRNGTPRLEWTGDAARPGSENAAPARNGANGGNGNGEQRREGRSNGDGGGGGGTAVASRPAPAKSGSDGDYDDGFGPMPEIPARESAFRGGAAQERAKAEPASSAMVFGAEDIEKARRYARDFRDLFQWSCPASIVSEISARGFTVQTIDTAVGDLNLDFYKVDITRFPSGWDGPRLLNHFMRNINDFLDTGNTEFIPYADSDRQRLASATPLGTVFKLDVVGPDNAAVVISDVQDRYFAVTTINTPDTGDHPVSGHRMFGFAIEEGKTVWFTRAADRPTLMPSGLQEIIFAGADALWKSMQRKVAAFINDNGGSATVVSPPFSERFNPTAVRLEVGKFDGAQGLSADVSSGGDASPAIVRPVLPNDQRARAGRIGGAFAGRLGEALDLGLQPKALDALLDTLDPPPAAQPMSYARSADRAKEQPVARAQTASRSVNWDDVELIPQPTDNSCWATAAAMVIGWRDRVSLTPETIGRICARSTLVGLSPDDNAAFASEIGLETEPPQSYSVEGFYNLLTNNGPLWVGKTATGSQGGHAVVVTGMYSENGQDYVRIADPWDRVVGTPGAQGNYASTHNSGSRYIMRYEDFQSEYELRIVGNPPVPQIFHAGGTGGRSPNTSTASAPPGFAMGTADKGRAKNAPRHADRPVAQAQAASRSVNWDDVDLIPQPTGRSCWAAAAAMVIGWRDQVSLTPDTLAEICSRSTARGLNPSERVTFAAEIGLETEPPQSYTVDGFYDLLTNKGPLWVSKVIRSGSRGGHAVVVTGMYSEGGQDYVRIADPLDRIVGAPGAPGGYTQSHTTGSRYIMRYEDFQTEYELRIVGDPPTPQILHAGGTGGRSPNTGTASAPPGYAMEAAPKTARGMDAGAIATIAGTAITLIAGNTGDITWNVPQWPGLKHPNDVAPATQDPYHENIIMLDKWPKIGGTFGIDDIYAWFRIRWQYNGTSLGRIYVEQRASDDAAGWSLAVTGTIEDDSRLYPRKDTGPTNGPDQVPALHVVLNYVFDEIIADSHIATSRISLYADGTHEIDSEWLQHARPFPDTPRDVARTS